MRIPRLRNADTTSSTTAAAGYRQSINGCPEPPPSREEKWRSQRMANPVYLALLWRPSDVITMECNMAAQSLWAPSLVNSRWSWWLLCCWMLRRCTEFICARGEEIHWAHSKCVRFISSCSASADEDWNICGWNLWLTTEEAGSVLLVWFEQKRRSSWMWIHVTSFGCAAAVAIEESSLWRSEHTRYSFEINFGGTSEVRGRSSWWWQRMAPNWPRIYKDVKWCQNGEVCHCRMAGMLVEILMGEPTSLIIWINSQPGWTLEIGTSLL